MPGAYGGVMTLNSEDVVEIGAKSELRGGLAWRRNVVWAGDVDTDQLETIKMMFIIVQ